MKNCWGEWTPAVVSVWNGIAASNSRPRVDRCDAIANFVPFDVTSPTTGPCTVVWNASFCVRRRAEPFRAPASNVPIAWQVPLNM